MSPQVLVATADSDRLARLSARLTAAGYLTIGTTCAADALRAILADDPDVILLDVDLPGSEGLELLSEIISKQNAPCVLMIAQSANVKLAVEVMRQGADNFLELPIDGEALDQALQSALRNRVQPRSAKPHVDQASEHLIGHSPAMRRVISQIERVARSQRATTLILGEPGTGKSLVAAAIHGLSDRHCAAFVTINCAAQADDLLEAELFGCEAGTVAGTTSSRRRGLFAQAAGGTLLLEQVDEISPALQSKLWRVIKDGHYRRLGGMKNFPLDVRLLSSTHHDLEQRVAEGQFREDLFYRLNVLSIRVPPLRERPSDIPLLAVHMLKEVSAELNQTIEAFSESAMQRLQAHAWPGNVRELRNTIERCALMHDSGPIRPADLGLSVEFTPSEPTTEPDLSLEAVERAHISRVIREADGNRSQAARLLGVNRTTLYNKLRRYGITAAAH